MRKYGVLVMEWLRELGYTHCFFVAGGNIMHLLDGAREVMTCIPVAHEVSAGIAVEYFNESRSGSEREAETGKAFALVTAGPGLTNIVSALAGAFLESRQLLVIGGQVKSSDLARGTLRQRGIQEIDGVSLARPVSVVSELVDHCWPRHRIADAILAGSTGRPGPVFLEMCLDVQGASVDEETMATRSRVSWDGDSDRVARRLADHAAQDIIERTRSAQRPVWLIGGGVSRRVADRMGAALAEVPVALMTTWNGADRLDASMPNYAGRPNTWGQRSANVLIQQADLVVAFGTRLGLQQTGFNWQQFAPLADVLQIDIDATELSKGHPRIERGYCVDANAVLEQVAKADLPERSEWLQFCKEVRELLPLREAENVTGDGYLCPYGLYESLSDLATRDDIVIPCSSGGANSVGMQMLAPKRGQRIVTDKGLASMGYGLAGAIGASLAWPGRRVLLIEGDGGFLQNIQELATVAVNNLPIKIVLFSNEGYASIRSTQRNYFNGAYLGCDTRTGLGFPDWPMLFRAFGIDVVELDGAGLASPAAQHALSSDRPAALIAPIDPEQTYFPKITSRVTESGGMESNPLHVMSPPLDAIIEARVLCHLKNAELVGAS